MGMNWLHAFLAMAGCGMVLLSLNAYLIRNGTAIFRRAGTAVLARCKSFIKPRDQGLTDGQKHWQWIHMMEQTQRPRLSRSVAIYLHERCPGCTALRACRQHQKINV